MIKKLKRKIRDICYLLIGRSFIIPFKPLKISKLWIGNKYGGFYVYPDILNKESIVYSFGTGEDISFDVELIERYGCNIFAFDPTPKSIRWIQTNMPASNFHFYDYGISTKSGYELFHLPKNPEHVSGSTIGHSNLNIDTIEVPMKSFKDIIQTLNHISIDILKMDIEGSEYNVLPDILDSGIEIKQICIEFHHRMIKQGGRLTQNAITLLKNKGFELFACSDTLEELSFIHPKYIEFNPSQG